MFSHELTFQLKLLRTTFTTKTISRILNMAQKCISLYVCLCLKWLKNTDMLNCFNGILLFLSKQEWLEIRPRRWWKKSLKRDQGCLQTRQEGRWKDTGEPLSRRWSTLSTTKVQTSSDRQADPRVPRSPHPTCTFCKSTAFCIQFPPPPWTTPKATAHRSASQMPYVKHLQFKGRVLQKKIFFHWTPWVWYMVGKTLKRLVRT